MDIKELRKLLGMTQEGFARALNVSVMTVRRWEAGTNKPSRLALSQIEYLKEKYCVPS